MTRDTYVRSAIGLWLFKHWNRSWLDRLLWKFTYRFTDYLNKAERYKVVSNDDQKLYLLRVYLWRPKSWCRLVLPHVYLHYFFDGDEDRGLHNHPWKRMASLILTGGYTEERLRKAFPEHKRWTRRYRPGMINWISLRDFHRVTLTSPERGGCWTLFVSWKRHSTQGRERRENAWGFYNEDTDTFEGSDLRRYRRYRERARASMRLIQGGASERKVVGL